MAEQGFTLTSPDFVPDSSIPAAFTCDGRNVSPALAWMHAPEGTQSFALVVEDPDAPSGAFLHWTVFDIPAAASELPRDVAGVGVAGRNDFQGVGYGGPCPPPNHGDHRYVFTLYALDTPKLGLDEGAAGESVKRALQDHVIDSAELAGRFERTTG